MKHSSTAKRRRGYTVTKSDYITRLRRIEGQVRGIQRMVDEDTYCIDVLTQIASATSALRSVAIGLLDDHMRHCVAQAATSADGDIYEILQEATAAIERLVRS